MWNKFVNKRTILILLFLSLFIIGTILIIVTPLTVKSSYYLKTKTADGETISFNIFEPIYSTEPKKKAVIIGHGFMANKEFMKGYAIELAAAGFVAVPFDFRGHGMSTGNLERGNLLLDVEAIVNYLNISRTDIDMDNLAYIGYSMGGGPGNLIVNQTTIFKAFIGVGTGLGNIRKGNSSNPLNVLMIYAKFDEAFELDSLVDSVATRVGESVSKIDTNQLYGSFRNGNATKIYLDDNSNHLTVAWDTDFTREARDWIINTFPDTNTVDENFYGNFRLFLLIIQAFGGIGLFFLILDPLSKLLKFEKAKPAESITIDIREKSPEKLGLNSLLYSILLGIPGLLIIVWIFLPLPLAIEGFVLSLLFGQSFGFLILFWRLGKKNNLSILEFLKKPFSSKQNVIKSIIFGIILATILYLIIYLSVGLNYVGMIPSISKTLWIPIYLIIGFIIFLIYHINLQMMIQSKYPRTSKGTLKIAIIHFGVQFLYIVTYILLVCIISRSLFYFGTMIPVATPILLISTFVAIYSYRKTGNIIAGTLINTFFFILIVSTIAPYQSLLSFLLGFLD